MPRFTKAQKEAAYAVLYHHVSGLDSQNPEHPMEAIQPQGDSYGLLEQLKARVTLGETLSPEDLQVAKTNLTADEQGELQKFLGDE
jgi:hypothetical protein